MSDFNGAPDGATEHLSTSDGHEGATPESVSSRDSVAAAFAKLEQGGQEGDQQRAMTADARARDEQGRFAAAQRAENKTEAAATDQQKAGDQPAADKPQDQQQATRGAPPGWSPASKDAYASLPESVKADIAKREQEVNTGLAELREYRDLRPYRDLAQRGGTSIANILGEVTKFEDTITRDPVQAIGSLAQAYGFDLRQAVVGLMRQTGLLADDGQGQGAPTGQAPQQMALPPEILTRLAEVDRLKAHIEGQASTQMQGAIQAFAQDPANEFFDNVGQEVAQIISADLARYRSMPPHLAMKEAYDKAVWLNPDTRAVLIKRQAEATGRASAERMQATAHQARQASKSLSGSPVNGATPGSQQPIPKSTRDAVAAAWDMHADI